MGISKEEFKQRIEEQVVNKNPGLLLLMRSSIKSGQTYASKRLFRCSELELFFLIEKDGEDNFKVTFYPEEDWNSLEQKIFMDVSFIRSFLNNTFVLESIEIKNDTLTIRKDAYKLNVKDYYFSLDPIIENGASVCLDLVNLSLMPTADKAIEYIEKINLDIKDSKTLVYSHVFTEKDFESLYDVSKRDSGAKQLVDYLSSQFQMAQISMSNTTTEYLVKCLTHDFPKTLRN